MHILTGFMFELYQHSAWDISTEYIPVVTSLVCNLTEQHGVHIKEASVAEHNCLVGNTTCKTLEMPLSRIKIFWGTPRDPLDA